MSDKLTKADELAKAVREYYEKNPRATTVDELPMFEALAAYEAAPAETVPPALPIVGDEWERLSNVVGAAEATRILSNRPKPAESQADDKVYKDILEARVYQLRGLLAVAELSAEKAVKRVAVLEEALEGAKHPLGIVCGQLENQRRMFGEEYFDPDLHGEISDALKTIETALAARSASGSQPSREKEGRT